jgi:hypothetical protein
LVFCVFCGVFLEKFGENWGFLFFLVKIIFSIFGGYFLLFFGGYFSVFFKTFFKKNLRKISYFFAQTRSKIEFRLFLYEFWGYFGDFIENVSFGRKIDRNYFILYTFSAQKCSKIPFFDLKTPKNTIFISKSPPKTPFFPSKTPQNTHQSRPDRLQHAEMTAHS